MKNQLAHVKNYVKAHKKAIAFGTVTISVIVLQARAIKNLNGFLDEKGLTDEFYLNNDI